MSSRLLLALLRNLPDHSAYKTYARPPLGRGGRWREAEQIAAYHATQAAALRRDFYTVNGGEAYEVEPIIDPVDRLAAMQDAEPEEDPEVAIERAYELT
jgi:hypothetical protein